MKIKSLFLWVLGLSMLSLSLERAGGQITNIIIQNPSFEVPNVGDVGMYYSYVQNPTGTGWTFIGSNGGNVGIAANGSAWNTYQVIGTTNGTQYAFLQGHGGVGASISQTLTNIPAGSYTFSFTAAQRDRIGRENSTNQTVTVLVDGTSVGSFTPVDQNWYFYQTAPIVLNNGNHTLTFTNLPVPGDATILIDQVEAQVGKQSPSTNPAIQNPGFEIPYAGAVGLLDSYLRVPTNAGWIFTGANGGNAGIGVVGSLWSADQDGTPYGSQYAYLQGVGGVGASMSQTLSNLPAGSYAFTFTASQRDLAGQNNSTNQTVTVLVDGTNVGSFTPADTNWYFYRTAPIDLNWGDHTLTFTNLPVPGDATILIDQVEAQGVQKSINSAIQNPGFETPYAGPVGSYDSFLRIPTNAGWIFTGANGGNAGIAANWSAWSAYQSGTPYGSQYAFLQGMGGVGASMSQTLSNLPSSSYSFTFVASQRDALENTANQTVTVLVDGTNVGSFTPADTNWYFYRTAPILLNEGDHILTFTNVPVPGDATILLDNVGIQQGANTNGIAQTNGTLVNTIADFSPIPPQTFGTSFTLNPPAANSGLPVSLSVLSGPATISGNKITLIGTGSVVLAANQPGDASHGSASEVTTSFTVNPADQTIESFGTIATQTNGISFNVSPPVASSGLPVSLSVLSGPATISNNTITPSGAGTLVLAADQSGNTNYNAAQEVTTSITVAPASESITSPSIPPQTYGVGSITLSATDSSGLPVSYTVTGPATLSNNLLIISGAGTVTLVTTQAGNSNFNAATPVTNIITVNTANQTIAPFKAISPQVNGMPFTLTPPVASSGLPVSLSVLSGPANISSNTITPTGVGTVVLAADQAGNANYNAATEVTTSFVVKSFAQNITPFASITNKTFGDAPFRIKVPSSSSDLPVTVTVQSGPALISNDIVTLTGGGSVVLAADQPGNTNFTAAPEITITFSVAPAAQRIIFPNIAGTKFNSAPIALEATASSGLPVTYTISGPVSLSDGNLLSVTGAGKVTVIASQSGDSNYNSAIPVTNSFSIRRIAQSITFPKVDQQSYAGTNNSFNISLPTSSSGLYVGVIVKSGPATISDNTVTLTGTGRVVLAATQGGDENYLPAREVLVSFTVKSFSQTIEPFTPIPNQPLGSKPIKITPPISSSGLKVSVTVESGPARIIGDKVILTGIGTVVLAANQEGNAKYAPAAEVTTSFVVTPVKD